MADSILKIRTQDGDKPIGYPGLADKPVANKTLDVEGAFADAKVVGDKFKEVKAETDSLKEDLDNQRPVITGINLLNPNYFIAEKWISSDGNINSASGYVYIKLPIVGGNTIAVKRNENRLCTSNNSGAIIILGSNGSVNRIVNWEDAADSAESNVDIIHYINTEIEDSFICFNILFGSKFDIRSTLQIMYDNIGNYKRLKSVGGAPIPSNFEYESKKWVAFGDSLTDIKTLASQTDKKNYVEYVSENLQINLVENFGYSGSGYTKHFDEKTAWCQRVKNIPTDTEVITLFGSGNDSDYCTKYRAAHPGTGGIIGKWDDVVPEDFDDAGISELPTDYSISFHAIVNHTLDNIIARCPYAKIGIITPTPWKKQMPNENYTTIMGLISDALIDIAKHRGIPYLDLYRLSQLRPDDDQFRQDMFLNADGTHPLSIAHKKYIYPQVREFIKSIM